MTVVIITVCRISTMTVVIITVCRISTVTVVMTNSLQDQYRDSGYDEQSAGSVP